MKILVIAAGLLACQVAPAWSESEFQITCPGRATMTVSRASYGLSTRMWPKRHFQVAAGQQRLHLEGGDSVAITRFRNGDRLVINKESGNLFRLCTERQTGSLSAFSKARCRYRLSRSL